MRNIILICISLILTCPCLARTITVDDDGPADFNNIQAAIDDANNGDTVLVKDGTYTGTGNHDIDFLGKAITVKSENGPENCIIDCNGSTQEEHWGFAFRNNENANSVLDGFTVIGVASPAWDDPIGAVYCRESSPIITNCNITGNTSWGVFCSGSNSSPTIKNCSISHSRAGSCGVIGYGGGGIYSMGGNPSIINCDITNNMVCGIYCVFDSSPIITNCNIANNAGRGISCQRYSSPTITNCNIIGNSTADYGGGIYCIGATTMTVNNSIIWANQASRGPQIFLTRDAVIELRYNDIQGGQDDVYCSDDSFLNWGVGNIDADPLFALSYDYHLRPNSPCIDAGTDDPCGGLPAADMDGITRPLDGDGDGNALADIGAYEYNPQEPRIAVSPRSLYFTQNWPRPQPQKLQIRNCGSGKLRWRITEDCDWLQVSPSRGISIDDTDQVVITAEPNGLSPGIYTCSLDIRDPHAANSPVTISVVMPVGLLREVPSEQYPTIQSAIEAAKNYDIVLVADGIYAGGIGFLGKSITVQSENGPQNCIIDCTSSEVGEKYSGFDFYSCETINSVLDGFTITNAGMGGIRCKNSSPTIKNCVIDNCWALGGGGIRCESSNAVINNCLIRNCSGRRGGGILSENSSLTIRNSTISGNEIPDKGYAGGICSEQSSLKIVNCVISGNVGGRRGGGIFSEDSSLAITNTAITGNSACDEGGGISCRNCNLNITNSILWSNTAEMGKEVHLHNHDDYQRGTIRYTDLQEGINSLYVEPDGILTFGPGNIDADPCFVTPGYWADANDTNIPLEPDDPNAVWVDGDYHLLGGSPCIDTGDSNYIPEPNETDLDGNPRIANGRVDMGAYEYIPPVEVEVKLTPQMLSCDSEGKWIKAHITLPEGYYPEDIDVNTPATAVPPGVESEFIEVFEKGKGNFDVQIYFGRKSFCDALSESEDGLLEVTVTGSLLDGRKFQGADTIKLKTPPRHHRIRQNRRYQNRRLFDGRRK